MLTCPFPTRTLFKGPSYNPPGSQLGPGGSLWAMVWGLRPREAPSGLVWSWVHCRGAKPTTFYPLGWFLPGVLSHQPGGSETLPNPGLCRGRQSCIRRCWGFGGTCGCEGTNGAGDADHEGSLGLVVVRVCLGGGTLVYSVCDREAVCASCVCVCARVCVTGFVTV